MSEFLKGAIPWINGLATLVVAAATAVLAWREIARRREVREKCDAEIKALAAVLLRRIVFAFGPDHSTYNDPSTDAERREQASYILENTRDAEDFVVQMLKLAPSASPEVAKNVETAADRLLRALATFARIERGDVVPSEEVVETPETPLERARNVLSAESLHERGRTFYGAAMDALEEIDRWSL